jgi:flagellin
MALTINTNLYAQNAQRNLRKTESPLATAMQRLSSTLRINSAKDDAAGLAVATRMQRQINGLTVAMRNANDGVSFAQTAEGAMDEMITSLQRIYELAEQASSYNTSTDRSSMNTEVSQLVDELNRIVSQTRYNGEAFLNQAKSIDIQVGTEIKETINVSTSNVAPTSMGISTTYSESIGGSDIGKSAGLTFLGTGLSANATINGRDIGDAIATTSVQNNSLSLVNRINQYTGDHGVTAFSVGNSLVAGSAAMTASLTSAAAAQYVDAGFLTINGVQIGSFVAAVAGNAASADTAITNLLSAINAKTASTGVTAYVMTTTNFDTSQTGAANQVLVLTNTTGAGISVSQYAGVTNGSSLSNVLASSTMSVAAGQNGKIVFNGAYSDTAVTLDGTATGATFGVGSTSSTVTLTQQSANSLSVTSAANANLAILIAKQGLDTLNSEKATLGAKLNRFESTIRNLDNVRENTVAARSRIMDTDFATETANMTKSMIMQQAGISVLAQANTLPQQILSLLGGR